MMAIIRAFYNKHRNILMLNKDLLFSGTVAFFVSAGITELYSKYDNNDFRISIVSIVTGFCISIPLFAFLFYMDNKRSQEDKSFRTLIMNKIVALYSVSNMINIAARFVIIYGLLKLALEPYEASMLSSLGASALSYFVTNELASKYFRLFNTKEDSKQ